MGVRDIFSCIIQVISKDPVKRTRSEIEVLLPWLRKNSPVLRGIGKDVLYNLVKGCRYQRSQRDDVILRQGEHGDSFYVILSGSTSVYIDAIKSGEEEAVPPVVESDGHDTTPTEISQTKSTYDNRLDRTYFGKFIMTYEAGKSFGEIALMTEDAVRNASIIADDDTDLLVINKELFEGTLKERQEEEYAERQAFIEACPLFAQWSPRFRRLLEMSIRKETYLFDSILVRQGSPVEGLHFITKGQGKILVNPDQHKKQFPKLFSAKNSAFYKELGRTLSEQTEKERTRAQQEQVRVRRKEGYASAERRLAQKSLTLCFVDESEVIGATEVVLGLETYAHTVTCTANAEVFILDNKNIERLINKKHPHTLDLLRYKVHEKITARLLTRLGKQIELYRRLHDKFTAMKRRGQSSAFPPEDEHSGNKSSLRPDMDRETTFNHVVRLFLEDKAPLIEPSIPGTVYYVAKSRERAQKRMSANLQQRSRQDKVASLELRLQRARKLANQRRQPRSRRELEKLTIGPTDAEHIKAMEEESNAVSRFLSQRKAGQYTAGHGGQHSSSSTSTASSSASASSTNHNADLHLDLDDRVFQATAGDDDPEGHIALTPKDIEHSVVRRVVVEMGDLQGAANTNRARIVSAMMDKRSRNKPTALQSLLRPTSAPLPRKNVSSKKNSGSLLHAFQSDSESEEEFDAETGNAALQSLEDKIRDFHIKHDQDKGQRCSAQVRQMKRFSLQGPQGVPVPGGTVLVRQRECQQPSGTYGEGVSHNHIRRFIVPRDAYSLAIKSINAFQHSSLTNVSQTSAGGHRRTSARPSTYTPSEHRRLSSKPRIKSAPVKQYKGNISKAVSCS